MSKDDKDPAEEVQEVIADFIGQEVAYKRSTTGLKQRLERFVRFAGKYDEWKKAKDEKEKEAKEAEVKVAKEAANKREEEKEDKKKDKK